MDPNICVQKQQEPSVKIIRASAAVAEKLNRLRVKKGIYYNVASVRNGRIKRKKINVSFNDSISTGKPAWIKRVNADDVNAGVNRRPAIKGYEI